MGISPFKTRYKLLLEKAQIEESTFKGNVYTEYGNILEPKIRDYISNKLQIGFVETSDIIEGEIPVRLNTDGYAEDTILEIKTTSEIKNNLEDYRSYLVQLLFYMHFKQTKYGVLAVYERPKDFDTTFDENNLKTYKINISDYSELLDIILYECRRFWKDLEQVKNNYVFGITLQEEYFVANPLVVLSNQIISLENKLAEVEVFEKQLKDFKEQLKVEMENNSVKKQKTPNGISITLVEDGIDKEVQEVDTKKLIAENKELALKYTETKIKKGRLGFVKITIPKEEK